MYADVSSCLRLLSRRVIAAKSKDKLGIGRSREKFWSVASAARYHGVDVGYPSDVNAPEFLEELRGRRTDVVLSVSCPQIFKEPLISLP